MAQQSNSSTTCIVIAAIGAAMMVMVLVCGGLLVGLTLPAVQAAREAARRMQCSNNMKQIAIALHNYHAVYDSLPPAFTVDDQGNRLHSWRTLILPFMEEQDIYDQIDLSKPWNHPDNELAMESIVPSYRCPSSTLPPGHTTYVAVVDPNGVFSGSNANTFNKISDGTSNTVMVAEARQSQSVHWMEPKDLDLNGFVDSMKRPSSGQDRHPHTAGANAALADGSVRFFSNSIEPETIRALVTKDGNDIVIVE
jgi:prepilin-type processing-associated H-X9-DG protein